MLSLWRDTRAAPSTLFSMALLPSASGRGARSLLGYILAGLVPLFLLAALVVDRAGDVQLLEKNPALQAAADLERAGEP